MTADGSVHIEEARPDEAKVAQYTWIMCTINRRSFIAAGLSAMAASFVSSAAFAEPAGSSELPNPFYAMDTSFQRAGLNRDQQLDLVAQLGFAGVAWTHEPIEKLRASLQAIEQRSLKMFTIYCDGKVDRGGALTFEQDLLPIMAALKGHGTIIWIHIGGQGPDFKSLTNDSKAVKSLRSMADRATENGLRIAIYPHFGEWTAHFADATRLADLVDHPNLGVTFNLCHALAGGDEANIPALLEQAKKRLFTATICGADRGVRGADWNRLIQTLDRGTFDVASVLKQLHHLGFEGPIGFQGYGIKGDARSILQPTIRAWHKLSHEVAS